MHTVKESSISFWNRPLPLKHYLIMGYNRFHIAVTGSFAKIRLVFGCPMIQLAGEKQLFYGYFFMLKQFHSSPIAYGREIYNGGMAYINNSIPYGDVIICDDISGFDFHVYFWLCFVIMEIIFNNFICFTRYWPCFKESNKWFFQTRDAALQYKRFYNVLVVVFRWFTELKVLLPTGHLMTRAFQFLPSGLFSTTFLGSAVNLIVTCHICLVLGLSFTDITFIIVLGDDLLFTLSHVKLRSLGYTPNQFYKQFDAKRKELYNLTSLSRPTYVGTDQNRIVFLHYRNQNGRPIRDLKELTAGALHRERYVKDQHLASVCVGLAYAAVATCREYHSCLREAYTFICKVSASKGITQEVNKEDRFLSELLENSTLTEEQLLNFPSYEEVFDRVTRQQYHDETLPHRTLNSLVFARPYGAHEHLFEQPNSKIILPQTTLNNLRNKGSII